MLILAVDTSFSTYSVALARDGSILAEASTEERSKQTEQLIPAIEQVLSRTGVDYPDLDLLVSTIGPGSFTGVRIGIAAIKGFSLVYPHIPTYGVSTLETLAWRASQDHPNRSVTVLLDALRGQVYAQQFNADLSPATSPELVEIDAITHYVEQAPEHSLYIGNGCQWLSNNTHSMKENMPEARDAALLAESRYNPAITAPALTPIYIRSPDAKPSVAV